MRLNWMELGLHLEDALKTNKPDLLTTLLHNVLALTVSYDLSPETSESLLSFVDDSNVNALIEQIDRIVEDKPERKMIDQQWFMSKMRALNYGITGAGECYGLSQMAMQAFFAKDMETFNRRLEIIYQMPLDAFFDDFYRLREQKEQLLIEGRQDKADEINALIIDLYAFFDGIALNQRPILYLFGENYQPLSQKQDIRKTGLITRPVALETKDEQGNYPNQPMVLSSLTGAYNRQELRNYFKLLKNNLGNQSFSLNLLANMHSIMLAYDAKTKRWLLVDPSHLPGEEYIDEEFLSSAIWTALLADALNLTTLVMATQISVLASDEQWMQQQFETLCRSSEWLALHRPDKIDVQYPVATESPESLMAFYNNPDTVYMEPIDLLKIAIHRQDYYAAVNIMIMTGVIGSSDDFATVFSSQLSQQQNQLLSILNIDQKIQLINDDIQVVIELLEDNFYEFISIFIKLNVHAQLKCLADFIENPVLQFDLLSTLSIEQRANIMCQSTDYLDPIIYCFFDEKERQSFFPQLEPLQKGYCVLYAGNPGKQLLNILSHQDKVDVLNTPLAVREKTNFFLLLSDQDQQPLFSEIAAISQGQLLIGLTSTYIEFRNILLGTLNIDEKFEMISDMFNDEDECELFLMLTEPEQLSIIQRFSLATQKMLSIRMATDQQQRDRLEQKKDLINSYRTKTCFIRDLMQEDLVVVSTELTPEEQLSPSL